MKKSEMIERIDKRIRRMRRFSYRLLEDFQQEDIHEFRLEVKKLKALVRLIKMEPECGHGMHISDKVKLMYRFTGLIRNLQLQKARFDDSQSKPQTYLQFLKEEEKQCRLKARELGEHDPFDEVQNLHRHLPEKLNKESIHNFVQYYHHYFLLIRLLTQPSDEELHRLRKCTKNLLYTWHYTREHAKQILPGYLSNKETLSVLAEELGTFHDRSVALQLLDEPYTRLISEEEMMLILNIQLRLRQQQEESRKLIRQELFQITKET